MRYIIATSLIVLLMGTNSRAQVQQYWSRSIIDERIPTNEPHEVDLTEVAQREILIGGLIAKNKSPEELPSSQSVMVIEGHQGPDGTFWPTAELQVQKEKNSEWTKIGSTGNEPPSGQLKIYTGMIVSGLRINLDPFKAYLGKFRFGRILLTSGDEAVFLLNDLKPSSSEKNK